MKSFMYSNDAREQGASAARGFHDDDIMSTMLAFWEFHPKRVEEVQAARAYIPKKRTFQYK
jgi:hypothetical protein